MYIKQLASGRGKNSSFCVKHSEEVNADFIQMKLRFLKTVTCFYQSKFQLEFILLILEPKHYNTVDIIYLTSMSKITEHFL